MTTEATEERAPRSSKRAQRGGNTLVQKVADSLEGGQGESLPEASAAAAAPPESEPEAPGLGETGLVATDETEARRAAVSVSDGAPPEFNPFLPQQGTGPAPTAKVLREERAADRAAVNKPTPSTKRLGSIGKKLPGAERAKVHKRLDSGQLAFVGEYTEGDLAQSQDMESFLNKYIKPVYGPGEYQITGIDAQGRQFDMGFVNLLSPIVPTALTPEAQLDSPLGLLRSVIDRQLQQATQQPAVVEQKDPIEMLGRLHDLKTKMDPPPPAPKQAAPKDNSLAIAVVSGITTVASSALALMLQPKPMDPFQALMMKRMLDDDGGSRKGGDALPPMAPPVDPTVQLKNLAEVVQTLGGGANNKSNDDRLLDFLMKDRMTPADVISLVEKVKSERGTDGLKKSMEDVGIMFNALQQLRQHTEPGGSGMWDAIGALAQNTGLGGMIADAIRARRGGGQATVQVQQPGQAGQQQRTLPPGQQQDPLVLKQRELIARRLLVEEQELLVREKQLAAQGVVLPKPPQLQQPTAPQAAPPAAAQAPAATQQPQATQPAAQAAPDGAPKTPKLPRDIADYINRYIEAKDEANVVEVTIALLSSLQEEADWKGYSEVIFNYILKSDRERFLHYMASFFVGLRASNLINDDLGNKVMSALKNNFETIVEMVQLQMAQEAEGEGNGEGGATDGADDGDDSGDDDGDDGDDGDDDGNDVIGLGKEEPLS